MSHKKFDSKDIYECPKCNGKSLHIYDEHKNVRCEECGLRGHLKKHLIGHGNDDELKLTIDGVEYYINREKKHVMDDVIMNDLTKDEQVCVVVNGEVVCVPKKVIEDKS